MRDSDVVEQVVLVPRDVPLHHRPEVAHQHAHITLGGSCEAVKLQWRDLIGS